MDRRRVRNNQLGMLDRQQQQQVTNVRHERCTMHRIAKAHAVPLSTTGRWLKSMGQGRHRKLQPKKAIHREQWAQPGDMIDVTPSRRLLRSVSSWPDLNGWGTASLLFSDWGVQPDAGCEKAHVAVNDAIRLAYVEVLPDAQKATTLGFLVRAVSWFEIQGISGRRVL